MKIYTFFRKPDNTMINDDSIPLNIKYALYAITPTKELAKVFQKSRNMDKFIMKVIDCEDDGEEYDMYLVRNRSRILNWYWLSSFKDKNGDNQRPYWVRVLITENELNFTTETTDTGTILNRIKLYVPIDIFSGKTKEALYRLRYDKAMMSVTALSDIASAYIESPEDGDFWDTGLSYDMFAIFMLLYKDTFSTDFFSYVKISNTQPEG